MVEEKPKTEASPAATPASTKNAGSPDTGAQKRSHTGGRKHPGAKGKKRHSRPQQGRPPEPKRPAGAMLGELISQDVAEELKKRGLMKAKK